MKTSRLEVDNWTYAPHNCSNLQRFIQLYFYANIHKSLRNVLHKSSKNKARFFPRTCTLLRSQLPTVSRSAIVHGTTGSVGEPQKYNKRSGEHDRGSGHVGTPVPTVWNWITNLQLTTQRTAARDTKVWRTSLSLRLLRELIC